MSKELTPLEAWKLIDKSGTIETFCIIEAALKRLEEHDKIFKKYNIDDNWLEPALYVIKNHFPIDTEIQLKKLKALDIIKEKSVIPAYIMNTKNLEEYNKWLKEITFRKDWFKRKLTQEEYDLLKEVLCGL